MCDGCTDIADCRCPCQDGDLVLDYYGMPFCSQCGCKAEPLGEKVSIVFPSM